MRWTSPQFGFDEHGGLCGDLRVGCAQCGEDLSDQRADVGGRDLVCHVRVGAETGAFVTPDNLYDKEPTWSTTMTYVMALS